VKNSANGVTFYLPGNSRFVTSKPTGDLAQRVLGKIHLGNDFSLQYGKMGVRYRKAPCSVMVIAQNNNLPNRLAVPYIIFPPVALQI
jgi:hypothetical protein